MSDKIEKATSWKTGYDQATSGKPLDTGWFPSQEQVNNIRDGYAEGLKDKARNDAKK